MRLFQTIILFFIICTLNSCSSGGSSSSNSGFLSAKPDKKWEAGKDYFVVKRYRVEDAHGFGEPVVAYSLLLPDQWKVDGGITWRVGHYCVNESVSNRMTATSADHQFQLDFFPLRSWEWSDDPYVQQSKQGNQGVFKTCDFMPAMDADAYLKNEFVHDMGDPKVISIEPNPEVGKAMEEQAKKNSANMAAAGINTVKYNPSAIRAKLKFADGSEGLALCAVNQTIFYMQNFMTGGYTGSYTCQADQKIVLRYPAGKEAEARKLLSMAVTSIRINPQWQTAVAKFFNNVSKVEQVENAKRSEIWRKSQADIAEIQKSTWEYQQQSQDRIAEETGRVLRGVEQWSDPATGQSADLSAGYNEAWAKGDGTYILSNDPLFDPNVALQEDWKKLSKK
ncbi:hypothetical protein BH11BAC2_BH11BAC2_11960 [soil metagenome]